MRRLERNGDTWSIAAAVPGQPNATDWGRDYDGVVDYHVAPDGSLWYSKYAEYYGGYTGEIRRITYSEPSAVPLGGPGEVALFTLYPTPAPGFVRLSYSLPSAALVELDIHDVGGRLVRKLMEPVDLSPGMHAEKWDGRDGDGRDVPAGLYLARLRVAGRSHLRRFPLLR